MPEFGALRVLDVSESVAGQYCARRFADHGADVVLAEPAGGTITRRRPGLFEHLNRGKRVVALTDAAIADLAGGADVLISSRLGPDLTGALTPNPRQVHCAVSEFGETGPYADWLGSELIHQSFSGLAYTTGDAARAPLYGFGHRAYYGAGAAAFATAVAALIERDRSGLGQQVSASVLETAAAMAINVIAQHDYNGSYAVRGDYPGPLGVYRCADGWIALFVLPGRWTALTRALGLGEVADDARFTSGAALAAHWADATAILAAAVGDRTRDELVALGQGVRNAVAAVMDVADVVDQAEAARRDYWVAPERPQLCTVAGWRSLPPTAAGPPAAGPPAAAVTVSATRRPPLSGIRVVELTTAWAGPMTGGSLAYLGAEVIKVETRGNIDAWRGPVLGGDVRRYPDLTPGERPYNRSSWFNTQNHDKLSVELDLKQPTGLAAVEALIARTDVLICNLAPGALDRLGLGYDTLRALRPGIVVLEITGFDRTGPMARYVGVGPTIEACTGMMSLIGYGDGAPYNTGGAYLDPLGALEATGRVLTALAERDTRGGQRIELDLCDTGQEWLGEYFIDYAAHGTRATAMGNRHPVYYPHDVFPTAGDGDEWVAVAVIDDRQWPALCEVIGRHELAEDPALATAVGRRERSGDIEQALGVYCAGHEKWAAAAAFQRLGVPSAPVYCGAEVAGDPQLDALGFSYRIEHPDAGTHRYQGLPYRLADSPGAIRRAAPCLGQHSDLVLRTIADLGAEQVAELFGAGVALGDPRAAAGRP